MFKTEFHVHTIFSKDSLLSYWFLLIMLKIKKINTIVITDHNEICGAIKYKQKMKKYGIEVIVGEEIFTNKGEIIGIGLNKKIESGLTPKETIRLIKEQNGLVCVPHPYDEKRFKTVLDIKEIYKNKKNIDFIEVHNGRNLKFEFSIKQEEIAEKYKIKKIIGSDSHTFFEVGRNYIISNKKIVDIDDFKKIDLNFNKKNCIKFSHKCTKIVRIMKIILGGNINELFRIINKKCRR